MTSPPVRNPLPPYGKTVYGILHDPNLLRSYSGCNSGQGSIWIATGVDAWEWQANHPRHLVLVLPQGAIPAEFDWRPLAGHEPILLLGPDAEDTTKRQEIARALFRDGVKAVCAISSGRNKKMMRPGYQTYDEMLGIAV